MLFDGISKIHVLVAFLTFSFIFAMIWTNIHKGAVARFITFLCDNDIFDKDSAVTLQEMNIKGLSALIIKSAAKKEYGIGKSTCIIKSAKSDDKLEAFIEGKGEDKYYLCDNDVQALKKRYGYSPLSIKFMLIFIVAIIITAVLSTIIVEYLISSRSSSNIDDNSGIEQEQTEENTESNDNSVHDGDEDNQQDKNGNVITGPSIPL